MVARPLLTIILVTISVPHHISQGYRSAAGGAIFSWRCKPQLIKDADTTGFEIQQTLKAILGLPGLVSTVPVCQPSLACNLNPCWFGIFKSVVWLIKKRVFQDRGLPVLCIRDWRVFQSKAGMRRCPRCSACFFFVFIFPPVFFSTGSSLSAPFSVSLKQNSNPTLSESNCLTYSI